MRTSEELVVKATDGGGGFHFDAAFGGEGGVFGGHERVVGDAGGGDVEGAEPADVRLDLAHGVAVEELEAGEAIGFAAGAEVVEAGGFRGGGGDDELATDLVRDGVPGAEGDHFAGSGDAHAGFEGAGFVVDAGVDDSTVVAGLMAGEAGFFFQDDDAGAGEGLGGLHGEGEADNSAADDG